MKALFVLSVLYIGALSNRVTKLPGFGEFQNLQIADFCSVGDKKYDGHLFYWFMSGKKDPQARDRSTPLIVWLNGGPGASSLTGQFVENGPYRISKSGDFEINPYAWTNIGHMLFIDNPVGSGYSYTSDGGYVTSEAELSEQFYNCILQIFDNIGHGLDKNPLYITGESYAGKYIPHMGYTIVQKNQAGEKNVNLKALLIGNGGYDPLTMYRALPEWYYTLGLVDFRTVTKANDLLDDCTVAYNKNDLDLAFQLCNNASDLLTHVAGDLFLYDIRQKNASSLDAITDAMGSYLNSAEVMEIFGTTGHPWTQGDGTSAPNPVVDALSGDVMLNNTVELFEPILESGVRMLVYVGNMDGSMWGLPAHKAVLNYLSWPGAEDFWSDTRITWKTSDGLVGGYVRSGGNLTFLEVHNSGHLVPMDQPLTALEMVKIFISESPWV